MNKELIVGKERFYSDLAGLSNAWRYFTPGAAISLSSDAAFSRLYLLTNLFNATDFQNEITPEVINWTHLIRFGETFKNTKHKYPAPIWVARHAHRECIQ